MFCKIRSTSSVLFASVSLWVGSAALAQTATLPIIEINPLDGGTAPDLKQMHQFNAIDLMRAGKTEEAIGEAETALKLAKETGRKDVIASCYSVLGKVYRRANRYQESLNAYQQALDYWKTREPGHNPLAAMIHNNMGEEYRSMGEFDKALPVLLEAKSEATETDPTYCVIMENLGYVYFKQNKAAEAETYWKKAVEIAKKEPDQRSEVDSMLGLVVAYLKQDRFDDARAARQLAIQRTTSYFGAADPRIAQLNSTLIPTKKSADLNKAIDEWKRLMTVAGDAEAMHDHITALSKLQAAQEVMEQNGFADSEFACATVLRMGNIYAVSGNLQRADECFTKAVPLFEKHRPQELPIVKQASEVIRAKLQSSK